MLIDYIFEKNAEALKQRIKEKNLSESFNSTSKKIDDLLGDNYAVFRIMRIYFFFMGSLGGMLNIFTSNFNPLFILFLLISFFAWSMLRHMRKNTSDSVYKLFKELDFNLIEDSKKYFSEYSKKATINQEEFDEYSKLYKSISKNEKGAFEYFVSLIKEVEKTSKKENAVLIPSGHLATEEESSISFSNDSICIIDSKLKLDMNTLKN